MSNCKYPHLFSPITVGNVLFKNRIISAPTSYPDLSAQNWPDNKGAAFFIEKAKGGVGCVTLGESIVHTRTGQSHTSQFRLDDPLSMPSMTDLARRISQYGCVPSLELSHGGRFAHVAVKLGGKVKSPPMCKDGITYGPVHEFGPTGNEVFEMPEDVIYQVIEAFGAGAAFAKHCGYQMVTIHGGHGWLISQFLSPAVNKRTDKWGGSFENRMRLALLVIESVRKAVGPKFPIEFRMSVDERMPGGYDMAEGVKIAQAIDGLVDIIHCSAGNHEVPNSFTVMHPSMFHGEGCNVYLAAEVKKHVKKSLVATVGALNDPAQMEEIIASGKADFVEVARALLADQYMPLKAQTGHEEDIDKCMRCYVCMSGGFYNRRYWCAINPKLGHEYELQFDIPPAIKKKVLVAGGGVGGMEAALIAAQRGHEVILCEKSGELGGVLNLEKDMDFKKDMYAYIRRQARRVEQANIDLRLNTPVTPELAREIAPDVILCAIGAVPIVPDFPGIDGDNVYGAFAVHRNPGLCGKKVAIIGGGLVGSELAIHLSRLGHEVSLIEMLPELPDGGNVNHMVAIQEQLDKGKVDVHCATRVLAIKKNGVEAQSPTGKVLVEADTVVYSVGMKPLWDEAMALNDCAPEVHFIGDCRSPRQIVYATQEAFYTARNIGAVL